MLSNPATTVPHSVLYLCLFFLVALVLSCYPTCCLLVLLAVSVPRPPHCSDKQKALYAKYCPSGVHQPRLEVHLEFLAPLGAFD